MLEALVVSVVDFSKAGFWYLEKIRSPQDIKEFSE